MACSRVGASPRKQRDRLTDMAVHGRGADRVSRVRSVEVSPLPAISRRARLEAHGVRVGSRRPEAGTRTGVGARVITSALPGCDGVDAAGTEVLFGLFVRRAGAFAVN